MIGVGFRVGLGWTLGVAFARWMLAFTDAAAAELEVALAESADA